jgi:hypothetical protein
MVHTHGMAGKRRLGSPPRLDDGGQMILHVLMYKYNEKYTNEPNEPNEPNESSGLL